MMKFRKRKDKGMTLPEVLISFGLGLLLVGIALSMWYFAYKNWTIEGIRTRLRINLEIATEHIKKGIRLSSISYTSLYKPPDETEYKALSFPAATPDENWLFPLDYEGKIYWDKSVIYHVYENPPDSGKLELRRTEFTNNHVILKDTAQREAQLASVVIQGDGTSAPNSSNASTKVIFKNLIDLTIKSQYPQFDGYSPTTRRSDNISFGSIKLTPGNHEFKFQVKTKNDASSGYKLGIDAIAISPSGCLREAETFVPSSSSGESYSKIYALGWSGNNYLEYQADEADDYITFTLYYDLWQETNFGSAIRTNTILTGNDLYVQLANAEQGGGVCWEAAVQTGSAGLNYPSEIGEPSLDYVAIRNVLSGSGGYINVSPNQKLVKIRFIAHSENDLQISAAWIVERSSTNPEDGTGTPVQLFFGGSSSITIPFGSDVWSDWAAFTIDPAKDYFVTFYTTNGSFKYWRGPVDSNNSYYHSDPNNDGFSDINDASANDWIHFIPSPNIYAGDVAENWASEGTVTSQIYDTKIDSASEPNYNRINWDSYESGGTSVSVEVCASDNSDMSGATEWSSVNDGGFLPSAVDGKRYIQFRAILTTPFPHTAYPWIDNVVIDWPGQTKMCEISGYFTQKPDYGIIKLLVDGKELTKGFEFNTTVFEYFQNKEYKATLTSEIEPRNTGR